MARIAQTFTRYTWETGNVVMVLIAIKDSKSTAFGAKEDSPATEPQWQWDFVPVEDAKLVPEEQRKYMLTTGVTFGSKKSKLTKIYNGIEGRLKEGAVPLTNDEVKKIDADTYVGGVYNLMLIREISETGEPINRLAAISRASQKEITVALKEAALKAAADNDEDEVIEAGSAESTE